MARHIITPSMLLSLIFLLIYVTTSSSADERRPYIIHMDKSAIPAPFATHDSWYTSTISSLSAPDGIAAVHLYTYNHVMNGFSAVMSQAQLNQLERMPGHLATYPETYAQLMTDAEGAIFATDLSLFMYPIEFFMSFVMISFKDGEIMKRYITKAAQPPTMDIKFQITPRGLLTVDVQPIRNDYLVSEYVLASGTSISSPLVVGVAALLRAAHPNWSPAAIRSALMTTAYVTDNIHGPILDLTTGTAATPLDYGAGHIDPNKAMDPGLVYDLDRQDYINFLCGLNYTTHRIKIITRGLNYTCTKATLDLNYPSFMVILNNTNSSSVVFTRVLTNVADSPSIYRAVVKAPTGMRVVVDPPELKFDSKYSKQGFTMSVQIDMAEVVIKSDYIGNYGYLNWYEDGGNHVVRTPIASAFGP
ncbi:subtilisin-like protease SBT3 [Magnolia sinica]|uniref:subtilisin-like protease SBT3 n=1 Tax=Magnolia sinica TaxID=86752 RepID=UPI00265A71DB|nr:subtilisin-like protease SBT3 [Magnolia sinica]